MAERDERQILCRSMFGYKTQKPYVMVQVFDLKPFQLAPEEARDLALNLLGAAEAAEQDGFLVAFFTEKVGQDLEHATNILRQYRSWREQQQEGTP